jgi:drug/metabolite transporter (DMT)-like permease
MAKRPATVGTLLGLGAAVSFGVSTPISKGLLDSVGPQLLAGLLYLGAFLALAVLIPARRRSPEARIRRADLPRLGALTLAGGIVAPVLLLVGLEQVQASTGSLLLNLEGPATLLLGVLVFREHLGRTAALGAGCIFAGAVVLTFPHGSIGGQLVGIAFIAAACACWGLDNNLTQSLTVRDPFSIVTVKTGVAATVNVGIALILGAQIPGVSIVLGALGLGAVAFGMSVVLDAYALRLLGAARESAIFAVAPFVGAVAAWPLLGEQLGTQEIVAGAIMAIGVFAVLREVHEHSHEHEPLIHDHVHVHDVHHQHEHPPGTDPGEAHSHQHYHDRLVHAHAHISDVHHRHDH